MACCAVDGDGIPSIADGLGGRIEILGFVLYHLPPYERSICKLQIHAWAVETTNCLQHG